jgi:hypothetical protein
MMNVIDTRAEEAKNTMTMVMVASNVGIVAFLKAN